MTSDYCYRFVCFVPLDANSPRFFGFSELLAGLALMVLAWTLADIRYRFRVRSTPLPLQGLTFAVVGAVGVLTLLTDLWRAEQWLVPRGNLISPAGWQALLGALFLLTFLTWTWFAFIRPPKYGKRNARRYAQTLYHFILKGSPSELPVVADELAYSAKSLIHHATSHAPFEKFRKRQTEGAEPKDDRSEVTAIADDILLLIGDKRFCRAIVESSPRTALAVFNAIGETEKYYVQVGVFAKNILNEGVTNRDSFMFHEAEGYDSGLIGYHKPLSQAMFSNHKMVEAIGRILDPDYPASSKWDAAQWAAYSRVVLMTFRDYVQKGATNHSFVLSRAKGHIEHIVMDLYKLDGVPTLAWDDDIFARLRVAVDFVKDGINILEEKGPPEYLKLRIREEHVFLTPYDQLASMIGDIIFAASAVRSPAHLCWQVQHNSVWHNLFNFHHLEGPAADNVKFKVRRIIYDEISDMKRFPNFKGAKILSFCLNVMGYAIEDTDYDLDSRALHKAVLSWTKKNYAWLHSYNPRIAEACLVDGATYDAANFRLVKTYPVEGLRREPHFVYLDVDPPSVEKEKTDDDSLS